MSSHCNLGPCGMADWERVWLSQVDEWWLVREDLLAYF